MIDVITKSGTVYRLDLDDKWWFRFNSNVTRERLCVFKTGSPHVTDSGEYYIDWEDTTFPVFGDHMYVASRNLWYQTTPVVDIIQVDSWESPPFEASSFR